MKYTYIIFLLICTTCFSQSKSEVKQIQKLLGTWSLEYFSETDKVGNIVAVKKSGTIEKTYLNFKADNSLIIENASNITSNVNWIFEGKSLVIFSTNPKDETHKIEGKYKLIYTNDNNELFMQVLDNSKKGVKLVK